MGWGSEASSGASTGASTASSMGEASNSMGGAAGTTGNMYGSMSDVSGNGASVAGNTAGGYGMDAMSQNGPMQEGPPMSNSMYTDQANYGTTAPSSIDKLERFYNDYRDGSKMSMFDAYKDYKSNGFGAKSAGYMVGKMGSMGSGGGNSAPSMTTNISYQQPENDYLRRRRGY